MPVTEVKGEVVWENNFKVKNIGGLKMLLEQAKPSFEKWTNKRVKIDNKLFKKIEAILKWKSQ